MRRLRGDVRLAGDDRDERLDQVHPAAGGGREVQRVLLVLGHPLADVLVLVGGVVQEATGESVELAYVDQSYTGERPKRRRLMARSWR
jgi:hypothetical protein